MRFVRSFTNFSGKIDAALMRVEGWLFPRMRRRWIRCVLSYLLFVSLFAWFALRLYGPGGAVDPTSRHRRGRGGTKGCIKKKNDSEEKIHRVRRRRSLWFDNNYWPCGEKKRPAGILISRETMQRERSRTPCLPSSSSTFVNSVLSSREFHLVRRYARGWL